jgi:tRNA pseudouridine55 synthase
MDFKITTFEPGVYGVYKPVTWTPLEAINQLKQEKPELANSPLTYAGRLDPMAEGLLLILDSSVVKNKEGYLGLNKTYRANILLGVKTDSFDLLGLPVLHSEPNMPEDKKSNSEILHPQMHLGFGVTQEEINDAAKLFVGEVTLPLPPYSSPPLNGKPLFMHAQDGKINESNSPQRTSIIHSIQLDNIGKLSADELKEYIGQTIPNVTGDFRIQEIVSAWDSVLKNNQTFQIISLVITCASGTYIRSLAYELGKKLGTGACVYKLERTRIGAID